MTNVVLCPNCGGAKTVSKPPYVAGDVNSWVDSGTPTYSCPTCGGRGWINVDSVPREDFVAAKSIALSSMETSEALMDECAKRADRIKELEAKFDTFNKACDRREISILKESDELRTKNIILGNMLLQNESEIGILQQRVFDGEAREDLVTAKLARRACVAEDELSAVKEMRDELLEDWEAKRYAIAKLESKNKELCDELDIKLLDETPKIVNPLIKSGEYAKHGLGMGNQQFHSIDCICRPTGGYIKMDINYLTELINKYESGLTGEFTSVHVKIFSDGTGTLAECDFLDEYEEQLEFENIGELYKFLILNVGESHGKTNETD